ncbi:acyloxyacyl hydrolase-like [Lytechinus variegatus]|uniref:acyloxyacyl hydrolase-like n=1 Tax=Lytechinus variegatus TaxID=7654 RepID=UPI001BB1C629|nr:acyloxyacyl hydrolase-like [Lytechinus variegatus]
MTRVMLWGSLLLISVATFVVLAAADQHDQGTTGRTIVSLSEAWKDSILTRGVNGGTTCAVCSLLVSLAEQVAEIHNETIVHGIDRICSFLPGKFQATCNTFVEIATPILMEMAFDEFITPDVACQLLNLCYTEPGQQTCHLFPLPNPGMERVVKKARQRLELKNTKVDRLGIDVDCSTLPILKELCELIKTRFGDDHLPIIDVDQDRFSQYKTLRGSHWRGKDCSDLSAELYPGRKALRQDEVLDSNCNGIYGMDPSVLKPFEETLCSGTKRMGTILLGDSAGAHFHIPPEWFTASELSLEVFRDVAMIVENEFDWPMTSAVTGYMNSTWSVLNGPTNSLYLRLRELNHCNHRDFQNTAVNGANSRNMNSSDQYGFNRDQSHDHPAMVIYSLIGNDVCNGHSDTINHMTTTEQMKRNFLSTLKYLDTKLPNGSYVIATGLADGRILYDTLKNRVHPIGQWRHDVKYPDVYNYLSCLEVSPCNGWMSSNESLRNFTSERAANLSRALQQVATSYNANNFEVKFIEFDFQTVVDKWKALGGETWQLIEPVDGFHPSQIAMYLSSEVLWQEIVQQLPDVIKSLTNPNNARIRAVFGDQGGY